MRFWSLTGRVPYESARRLQLALVDARAQDRVEDTVLFLEHEPVITQGRGLQFTGVPRERHMPLPAPLSPGMAFAESERGGDLTYHGPGQLVVYPILKLEGANALAPHHDVGAFLRSFEKVFIDEIIAWGQGKIAAESRENATGVWVGQTDAPAESFRKIASMGIAVRRWVTYHGIALNCVNDLKPFHLISPCGFSPEVMTRLQDILSPESEGGELLADWDKRGRAQLESRLSQRMVGVVGLAVSSVRRLSVEEALEETNREQVP